MLRTRLWMGAVLVVLAVGILVVDGWFAPWYPCLLLLTLTAALLAGHELASLFPTPRPRPWVCHLSLVTLVLSNWPVHLGGAGSVWAWVVGTLAGIVLLLFLVEAAYFREPGGVTVRLSLTLFVVCYLGLLASFFVQTRWLTVPHGAYALALAIFVPKGGDVGAYTIGRLFGRHRMSPILSPKKSWEGAIGSIAAAVGVACLVNWLSGRGNSGQPMMDLSAALGFGVAVGVVALLGDLMESLIKRDCERKDASAVVPGFGGVLDVLDSVVFSAPVSYAWLAWFTS